MKIYNSKAQYGVNWFSIMIWFNVFLFNLNKEPKYAVKYYDWSSWFVKGVLSAICFWVVGTLICSYITYKIESNEKK